MLELSQDVRYTTRNDVNHWLTWKIENIFLSAQVNCMSEVSPTQSRSSVEVGSCWSSFVTNYH